MSSGFRRIFVQPAAGDAGGSVGAAFYIANTLLHQPRAYTWTHNFLGPEYSEDEIRRTFDKIHLPVQQLEKNDLLQKTAQLIADQRVIGWFQGRMEFGPRSLGARSILADARNPENFKRVNLKIKFRESFRPFAPAVIEERMHEYFEFDGPSPHMLFVAQTKNGRTRIPAVTHVDGSARLQTITHEDHPLFYELLVEFERQTGCPVLINTSFNVRGEPIVCTPLDALKCFLRTDMDYLVIGNYIVEKKKVLDSGFVFQFDQQIALD